MKKLTIAVIAFALLCWAYPINTLAQTADQPKQKILVVAVHQTGSYKSEDIIIKNNAIQPPLSQPATTYKPAPVRTGPTGLDSGRNYSKEEVQQLIRDYSAQYGIPADLPLRVARCESGFNQFSKNKSSSASGVFQFLSSTWANQPAGKRGVSVLDADANVQAAVWLLAHGKTSMWVCK